MISLLLGLLFSANVLANDATSLQAMLQEVYAANSSGQRELKTQFLFKNNRTGKKQKFSQIVADVRAQVESGIQQMFEENEPRWRADLS